MSNRTRWTVASIALACFVWIAAEVARGQTAGFDAAVRGAIHSLATPALTTFMRAVTTLGSQAVILGISAGVAMGLLVAGQRREVWQVVATMSGAELWMSTLKALFHRQRPEAFFSANPPESYSFPSGHALLSFCCYGLLAALLSGRTRGAARWAIRILAALLILAIGISRVYLGVHHPTDVIAGYLVATVWMAIAWGRIP